MRRVTKFKLYDKNRGSLKRIPIKVLKFKTSKWVFVKKNLTNRLTTLNVDYKKYSEKKKSSIKSEENNNLFEDSSTEEKNILTLDTVFSSNVDQKKSIKKTSKKFKIKDYIEKNFFLEDELEDLVIDENDNDDIDNYDTEENEEQFNIDSNIKTFVSDYFSEFKIKNNQNKKKSFFSKSSSKVEICRINSVDDFSENSEETFVDLITPNIKPIINQGQRTYLRKFYKETKILKKYLESLYGYPVKIKRKQSPYVNYKIDAYRYYILRHWLRVDVLLWYLNLFPSTYETRQYINNQSILVNGKKIKGNYYLKKGDIITIDLNVNLNSYNRFTILKNKYVNDINIFPFLEFDYFTNTIVVLKNYNELTYEDMSWLIDKNIQLTQLLYKS